MNRTYRSIWNESLGAWVAASEHDSARGKPNKSAVAAAVLVALAALPSFANANTFVPGTTNGTQFTVSSCTSGSGNATVGRTTTGNTNAYPVDGSGTYSTVGGCNSTGNNNLAATAYGAFAQVTGTGGTATGFLSSAGLGHVRRPRVDGQRRGCHRARLRRDGQRAEFGRHRRRSRQWHDPLSYANSTIASGAGAVAIGSNATKGAQSAASDGIAIGGQSSVASSATSGIAVGRGATVNGAYGIAKATVSPPARRARTWRSARPAPPRTAARQVAARSRSVERSQAVTRRCDRRSEQRNRHGCAGDRRTTRRMVPVRLRSATAIRRAAPAPSRWATAARQATARWQSAAPRTRRARTAPSQSAIRQPRRASARLHSAPSAASPPPRVRPAQTPLRSATARRPAARPARSPSAPPPWPRTTMRRPSARTRLRRVRVRRVRPKRECNDHQRHRHRRRLDRERRKLGCARQQLGNEQHRVDDDGRQHRRQQHHDRRPDVRQLPSRDADGRHCQRRSG